MDETVQSPGPAGEAVAEGMPDNLVEARFHYRNPKSSLDLEFRGRRATAGTGVLGAQQPHRVVGIVRIVDFHSMDEQDGDLGSHGSFRPEARPPSPETSLCLQPTIGAIGLSRSRVLP